MWYSNHEQRKHIFSAYEKRQKTQPFNFVPYWLPNQTWYQDENFDLKKTMAIIIHMPPWLSMCLKWLQCYSRYRAQIFSVDFTPSECP